MKYSREVLDDKMSERTKEIFEDIAPVETIHQYPKVRGEKNEPRSKNKDLSK